MIRLAPPVLGEEEVAAITRVIASGMLVQGAEVERFERSVGAVVGTRHAIAVSSGTAALHLALTVLGVAEGDVVVTSAFSWPATANVIELCGARPAFVDIERDSFNISPTLVSSTLDRLAAAGERVAAILPVHAFGLMSDVSSLSALAAEREVPLVEDAACALGAASHGRPAGSWGDLGCFSFHPRKIVTTGEGGVITTDDDVLAAALRSLRNHGLDLDATPRDFTRAGFNYRMTDIQGALGVAQMQRFESLVAARRAAAASYIELLRGSPVRPAVTTSWEANVVQSFVVLVPEGVDRDGVIQAMARLGVETTIGTWHIPLTQYYRERYGHATGDFPVADEVASRALTIPLSPTITHDDQVEVVEALLRSCEQALGGGGSATGRRAG